MKKIISLVLAILMIMSVTAVLASATSCVEHDYVYTGVKESTCTDFGYDIYVCSVCGDDFLDWHNPHPKKAHDFEYSFYEGKEDWCYRMRRCKACGLGQSGTNEETDGRHVDDNGDRVCDYCHMDFSSCNHLCHKGGFFWNFVKFFLTLFKTGENCKCGYPHY